jgi:hypothetical protein
MPSWIRPGAFALITAGAAATGACGRPRPAPTDAAAPPASPADTAGLLRVRFARGTTSGIVNDSLLAGETRGYVIGAEQGQVMMVHAITWPVRQGSAPQDSATVRIYAVADGAELSAPSAAGSLWSGRLPATGDYVVRIGAGGPTAYTLAVQIPRPLSVGGADPTAAMRGSAPARAPVDYSVAGQGGPSLAASGRNDDPATLHVYGLDDGGRLAPLSERRRLWAGTLPASQDYIVSVVPADEGARYELTVTLR